MAMSGDWSPMATTTPQASPSKPKVALSYPAAQIVRRTMLGIST